MNHRFKGTGVALVTPFHEDGSIDFDGLTRLVKLQISGGTDFLVVQGTTGESPVLTQEEKMQVLNHVIEVNQNQLPIIYGLGGNNTAEICAKLKFLPSGVDGLLSVSPYYSKPLQAGIIAHYKEIASKTELPIILYNVPGRTSSNVSAATTLELAKIQNIVAMKEASGDFDQIMEILKNKPKDFIVISGDDDLVCDVVLSGGSGVISVIGQALPALFSNMIHKGISGDEQAAKALEKSAMPLIGLIFEENNPAGIKAVLEQLGLCNDTVRLPLVTATEGLKLKIKNALAEL